jgi:hypothetical protein
MDQLYELITGTPLFLKGSPAMGPDRFMLRQIINRCGFIPDTMLQSASNLESLRDNNLSGTFLEVLTILILDVWSGAIHGKPYQYGLELCVGYSLRDASGKEIASLADFLRMFLQINPKTAGLSKS